jgi:hypothetical protein
VSISINFRLKGHFNILKLKFGTFFTLFQECSLIFHYYWYSLTQVCPSVNTFFIFHIFKIENFKIQQCEHIEGSTDFLPTPIFAICLKYEQQNPLKISIFHNLALKIVKWTILNLTCWGLSNNDKNICKFQCNFQFPFYFFSLKKWFDNQ